MQRRVPHLHDQRSWDGGHRGSHEAFHDAFVRRMEDLQRPPSPSPPSARYLNNGASLNNVQLDDDERVLQLLGEMERFLGNNETVVDDTHRGDDCVLPVEHAPISPPQRPQRMQSDPSVTFTRGDACTQTPPHLLPDARLDGGGTVGDNLIRRDELRRRREWYENYVGWMMYYRHCQEAMSRGPVVPPEPLQTQLYNPGPL